MKWFYKEREGEGVNLGASRVVVSQGSVQHETT